MSQRPKTTEIRHFIVDNVGEHPSDIASLTAGQFQITRQAVHRHLTAMEESGTLRSNGKTRGRKYFLHVTNDIHLHYPIKGLEEHVPWEKSIRPQLAEGVPKNVIDICYYGFTEMLNNAIDHSESEAVFVNLKQTADFLEIVINDNGIGIFKKIKNELGLSDELEAIKQLAKGKLTTDPKRHTGEGVFFTSRIFDRFIIMSGDLYFSHIVTNNDWLIEDRDNSIPGTYVRMIICTKSERQIKDVFDKHTATEEDFGFSRTRVPVSLLQYGTDNLVSRSQAKRVVSRFEMFKEVYLDFEGVPMIGQAFADEIFRVFQNAHPEVSVYPMNANPFVQSMIQRAVILRERNKLEELKNQNDEQQKKLFD